tara:strand:+ start:2322 stop:2567 length:246 start_codon:yes stop_codon:yes gene_type:complete
MKITLSRDEVLEVLKKHALTIVSNSAMYEAEMETGTYHFPSEVEISISKREYPPQTKVDARSALAHLDSLEDPRDLSGTPL